MPLKLAEAIGDEKQKLIATTRLFSSENKAYWTPPQIVVFGIFDGKDILIDPKSSTLWSFSTSTLYVKLFVFKQFIIASKYEPTKVGL